MIRWFKQSFQRWLFIALFSVTLTLVIAGGILTIQGFQARIRLEYMERDLKQQALIMESIRNMLNTAEAAVNKLSENDSFIRAVETRNKAREREIYNELYQETEEVRRFGTVDIYVGTQRRFTSSGEEVAYELPKYYSVLREAADNEGRTVYSLDYNEATEKGSSLLVARQLSYGERPVCIIIEISRENLGNMLREALGSREGLILANSMLRPFCMLGSGEDGGNLALVRSNLMKGAAYDEGASDNIYFSELPETGMFLIYITPPVLDSSAAVTAYRISCLLAVISAILCFIVASALSRSISKPLSVITRGMTQFRNGDLDVQVELNREDEFSQLASGFNKTTVQVKEMLREQVEAEHRLNEIRIAMMQAQLNPHFLYNTLDTIKWVAKANQVPEIATLSAGLARILRGSISDPQFVTLEKELKMVESYCDIQRIRFDDSFDIKTEVDDELKKCIIPKLLLQPIVENAIIHGFEDREDGHIEIKAETESDVLIITVSDNGKGISDEMIRILNDNDTEQLSGHLGLSHVGTILKIYYGNEYGIRAERLTEDDRITGTRMTIRLPLSYEIISTD
jgi:two-component system sensor histidine kinase YesM